MEKLYSLIFNLKSKGKNSFDDLSLYQKIELIKEYINIDPQRIVTKKEILDILNTIQLHAKDEKFIQYYNNNIDNIFLTSEDKSLINAIFNSHEKKKSI